MSAGVNIRFAKMHLILNIFLWKMYAKIHFCIKYIFASNAFVTFCFAEHFPLENVMLNILQSQMWCVHFVLLNIFLWKMYAKMHFCIKCIFASTKCYKCIFAQLNIFLWKMYAKMHFASNAFLHFQTFCKQNVRAASNAFATFCWCKNAFLHSWTFSFGKCTPKCIFACKCIFASNAFDAKMHFCNAPTKCKGSIFVFCNIFQKTQHFCTNKMWCFALQKCIWCKNAFDAVPLHFALQKCCVFWCKKQNAFEHFPLQNALPLMLNAFIANVMLNIFLWKMWCWTKFSFGKCTLNIFLWKMYAKMHFGIKCILASNAFWCIKCICNILFCWTFAFGKNEHFPKENVRKKNVTFCLQNAQNAFVTFCVTKCTHQNLMRTFCMHKMLQMHFCNAPTKCTHLCFLQSKKHMHL